MSGVNDIVERLRSVYGVIRAGATSEAADEIERLRCLLVQANDAFDECTGDYAKELVDGDTECPPEPWRAFRSEQVPS